MTRLQSALEFMTTYGWIMIMISIVLAALYYVGVFNIASNGPAVCSLSSKIGCASAYLSPGGALSVVLQQASPYTINVLSIGCNDQGVVANMIPVLPPTSLPVGGNATFTTECYKTAFGALAPFSGTVGQNFKGYIIVNYTDVTTGFPHTVVGTLIEPITTAQAGGPFSFGAVAYVPITVTNTNALSSTVSSFQEQITIPASSYSAYEASDLGNIRFTSGSTEFYSWCESGCTSGSGSSVFWVNLGSSTISPSSNVVVDLLFLNSNTEYDDNYAGECPTCSASYGHYDNGASVFSFYDNFARTSLGAFWSAINSGGTTAYSVSNGLTITATPSSSCSATGIQSVSTFASNTIEDFFGHPPVNQPGSGSAYTSFGFVDSAVWAGVSACTGTPSTEIVNYNDVQYYLAGNTVTPVALSYSFSQPNNAIWTIQNGAATTGTSVNYANAYSGARSSPSLKPDNLGFFSQTASVLPWYVQWVRIRQYPPGGTMPTTSFGILT